jgi:hypothetical protein
MCAYFVSRLCRQCNYWDPGQTQIRHYRFKAMGSFNAVNYFALKLDQELLFDEARQCREAPAPCR